MKKPSVDTPSLFGEPLFQPTADLHVVHATFAGVEHSSFEALTASYRSLKVLTYSNSVALINRAAATLEYLEIIFGREDIVGEMAPYLHYQELLIKELIAEIKG